MLLKLLLLALVGGFIGWMTNVFAIKLMFRPLEPVNILGYKLQGLIPKRKADIARNIGEVVQEELISMEEIIDRMIEDVDKDKVIEHLKKRIIALVEAKMPFFVPATIQDMIMKYIDEIIDENGESMINELSENMVHRATSTIKISEIIEEKINEFELEKLEEIIIGIAKKELKHIEYLGGLIGVAIGLVQGLIILNL